MCFYVFLTANHVQRRTLEVNWMALKLGTIHKLVLSRALILLRLFKSVSEQSCLLLLAGSAGSVTHQLPLFLE